MAGHRIEALPAARPVLEHNGGTRFVLFRKDRVQFREGAEQFRHFRLTPTTPTRRVVASCCNTPVFLEFQNGHWLSLYAGLWPKDTAPSPQLRTMTEDLPAGATLDDDVPNSRRQSAGFFVRLLGAWIAMGFRRPAVPVGEELGTGPFSAQMEE